MKIWLHQNMYSIINIEVVELALDSHAEPYTTVMRRWLKIAVSGSKWGRLFFVVFIEELLAEPNQGNDKSSKFQDKPYHSCSFQLKPSLHFEPRRVGPPTWHRYLPIRRGSRFFSLFASNYLLPCPATSHWTSNATSHTPNTTWFTLFLPFCLKLLASYTSHVVLDFQRDMAAFQHDVALPNMAIFPHLTSPY